MTFRYSLPLLLLVAIAGNSALAQEDDRDPFCPLERNGNQCRARRNQYKCGAFFMELAGQNEELRWLGAVPDMLHKPTVRASRALMKSMGNLHKKNFRVIPGFCNEILANARCYSIMEDLAKVRLDSCEHNMLNEHAQETLGNLLCRKAARFSPGQNFQSFVSVGFFHSACGGNWTETHKRGEHLVLEQELCCKYEDGRSEYFSCDGSDFARTCDPEEEANLAEEEKGESIRVLDEKVVVRPLKPGRKESLISTVVSQGDVRSAGDRIPRSRSGSRSRSKSSQKKKAKPEIRTFFVKKGAQGQYEVTREE